jgi:hypothetical protein
VSAEREDERPYEPRRLLPLAAGLLILMLLELIWGVQWRWLATTVLVGVAVALEVSFSNRQRPASEPEPEPRLSVAPPSPPVAGPPVTAVRVPVPGVNPLWAPGQPAPPPEYFESRVESAPPASPPSFSPVATPPDVTLRWPRPDQTS